MQFLRPFFAKQQKSKYIMKKNTRNLTQGALIAALYVALTHLQNLILQGSATMAIQFRASEALCILAFFTPSAIWGLTVGCFLFNLTAGATPIDMVVGSIATLLAVSAMHLTRNLRIRKLPLLGLLMPGLFNGLLVGWELTIYVSGTFWLNAVYVAIGEAAVLLTLGVLLYYTLQRGNLHKRIFS